MLISKVTLQLPQARTAIQAVGKHCCVSMYAAAAGGVMPTLHCSCQQPVMHGLLGRCGSYEVHPTVLAC